MKAIIWKKTVRRIVAAFAAGIITVTLLSTGDFSDSRCTAYAASSDETGSVPENHDTYSSATSTSPFLLPGNTWVTPTATHGQNVFVVLPLVNMFKYNLKDVVITPVLATKTDDWPFEIDSTGYTEKIDTLVGEDTVANAKDRVQNCVWSFRTRDNVKTGYYKLDFTITYTNPACAVETCTISTYVKTVGLPENGTTDGTDANAKPSTPRVIVKGFTTDPAEVYAGNKFNLTLTIENTSKKTAVDNLELDLTGTVTGKDESSSYAAFLPTSGSNSFYVDSIPAGGTAELSMEFEAKTDLEQKPYVMDIKMAYEDDEANPFTGEANVSIPVKQVSKFDMSTPDVEPSNIDIGGQSDIMFSIYNTGKTKLYNVSVRVNDPALDPATAYVGSLDSGATGNVDMMVTGAQYTDPSGDGTVKCVISYEDEAGNVTYVDKTIPLVVEQDMSAAEETTDAAVEDTQSGMPVWQLLLIAAGAVVIIILLIVLIKVVRKRRKKKEDQELAEIDGNDVNSVTAVNGETDTSSGTEEKDNETK